MKMRKWGADWQWKSDRLMDEWSKGAKESLVWD